MKPWIRGWGADVEVLAPKHLREELSQEARRVARIYGWSVHRNFEEKTSENSDEQSFKDIFGG